MQKNTKSSSKKDQRKLLNDWLFNFGNFSNLKNFDKKILQSILEISKIKNIRKTLKISRDNLNDKKNRFLKNYFVMIIKGFGFSLVNTNYRDIIAEIYYPYHMITTEILEILPEAVLVLPRNLFLLLISKNLSNQQNLFQIFQDYKNQLEKQNKRDLYIQIVNWKSLDSINRLIYFLYQYYKKFSFNSDFELPNKRIISYLTGNSHEVVIRNFKKLQDMGYFTIKKGKVILNIQKLEQWVKNSKILI